MNVTVDHEDKGYWTYVVLLRIQLDDSDPDNIQYPSPEVAVLYWNGFVRLKTVVAPGSKDYSYGTSAVLGPFLPVDQDPTKVPHPDLHPRIESIDFDRASLASGEPTASAAGAWYSGAADGYPVQQIATAWDIRWAATDDTSAQMKVEVAADALHDVVLPNGRLGLASLSSMWSSESVHDSDTFRIGPLGAPAVYGAAADVMVSVR